MNNLTPILAAILPTQVATVVKFAIYAILAFAVCIAIIKVIKGINSIDRGEEGKTQIVAGIATPAAVFLVIGAFQAVGLWEALGIQLL